MEYIEGAYTYTAKPTETTRNAEAKISASKTEISVNDNTLALLQSTDMFGRVLQKAVTTGNAETAQENTAPFAAAVSDYGYEAADGTATKKQFDYDAHKIVPCLLENISKHDTVTAF